MNKTLLKLLVGIVVMVTLLVGAFTSHVTSIHAAPADTASLAIPYLSQYEGQSTQNYDCGPTSVAMLIAYYNGAPNESAGSFITDVRNAINANRPASNPTYGDTTATDLEAALSTYGLTYAEISNTLSPQPDAEIQAMEQATASGRPVIAMIHGADFGRGQGYGDHFVVVTGFSSDGQTVFLNDPDNQSPKLPGWIQGGQISVPVSTFSQAALDAAPGPYGIIVGKNDPATPTPGPVVTIHQVDNATCASRDDFFEAYGSFGDVQAECWANEGTANVDLQNVSQVTTGNNAGYIVTTSNGQNSTIHFDKWQTIGVNQDITQIVIFA